MLCTRTTDLVRRLQTARQNLTLAQDTAKLDKLDLLILDESQLTHSGPHTITGALRDRGARTPPPALRSARRARRVTGAWISRPASSGTRFSGPFLRSPAQRGMQADIGRGMP